VTRRGRRKLKPSTRIVYLSRDLKVARQMLEVIATKLSEIARAQEQGATVSPSDIREWSSECARIAHVCDGW
jgi:hypothetical protein